ncbi:PilZ domain-containing protein [Desulfobacterales bacterium HSG2]|nr:PilZ domain-containing protein [Desulfobacterales bacterium HSG2]
MTTHERRVHLRSYYEAPIMYAKFNMKGYHEATMYNISEGGMYFESNYALPAGSPVYIKTINFSADDYMPGAYRAYVAQVRWCRKNTNASGFGTGVQYMARGYIINGTRPHQPELVRCDLCGERTPSEDAHETDDSMHLCLNCFKHLGALIDGKIKKSIIRFVSGNVI